MKTIEIITVHDSRYSQVCEFANSVYRNTIGANARKPPNTMIAAFENGLVYGCIGLDTKVSSKIFLADNRFWEAAKKYSCDTLVGEQNIFAVQKFLPGIPILISAVSAYAKQIGIQKIAFTGIPVSCKAVNQLGFQVTILGKTKPSSFSTTQRERYAYWLEKYQPISCILDTRKASLILQRVMDKFSAKARIGPKLESCMSGLKTVE